MTRWPARVQEPAGQAGQWANYLLRQPTYST
jgi:hypothetical protein